MIPTEEEAKTKTCPHMRHCANPHHVSRDGDPPMYEHLTCFGSGCMAWRWNRRNYVQAPWGPVPETEAVHPEITFTALPDLGYCGLSGIPKGDA